MEQEKEITAAAISAANIFKIVYITLAALVSVLLTVGVLFLILIGGNSLGHKAPMTSGSFGIMDCFNNNISNAISTAADGFIKIEKIYTLRDSYPVAPEPDQNLFGTTYNPKDLESFLDAAAELMDGQEMLFNTDIRTLNRSKIRYYKDDTILAVTWKQQIHQAVYTFSEIKIAHPSQFRRFLADGFFGSERQYRTSEMAASVNAVVASAGDFHKYRPEGIVVYNGKVERFHDSGLDSCFIDDQGDLIFSPARQFNSQEEVQNYVDAHNIRFNLCFGPILLENGESRMPSSYEIGEIAMEYSRAALCQLGPLHYLVVTVNDEGPYDHFPNLYRFIRVLQNMGIKDAYNLDGGQTATIVMNDKVINHVSYGSERYISDIFYFATAIPERQRYENSHG